MLLHKPLALQTRLPHEDWPPNEFSANFVTFLAVASTQAVAAAIAAKDFRKAIDLRGAEFAEYHDAYSMTTATDQPGLRLSPQKQMNVAILHCGAPAGGMNSATRAAVAYCLSKGHKPWAIHNGYVYIY